MRYRYQVLLSAIPLLVVGAIALAQGYQPNAVSNLTGPISIFGNLSVSGTTTQTGTLKAGSTENAGAVQLDGSGAGTFTTYATAHCTCTSQTQILIGTACSAPVDGVVTITGSTGDVVAYTCL